ncbi:MAG: Nif3-like dinuclear metal center hexameric protein [Cellvibrionales bacterium]|nr:Nif3-like dinuclear metal center hexameric protein [Cellvibrionales bacterium]
MPVQRDDLVTYCNELLRIDAFKDYCPNGLQVEGEAEIKTLMTGVTASEALIDKAIELNADALLVHHGYFWKGENPCITGMKGKRIRKLMRNGINLLAYHLPLDAHPALGNNAQLGQLLGLAVEEGLDDSANPVGFVGRSNQDVTLAEFAQKIEQVLGRTPQVFGDFNKKITRVGWCTGGAQSYMTQAFEKSCDCFLSGEVSEKTYHESLELGVAYIAAGHHATERYGVKALGEHLKAKFDLEVIFTDIDNPV